MAENNQNLLNYVDYDFPDLVQQLVNRVQLNDTWKDTYRSSTGQMLIELFSYVGNLVLYYVERRASEQYLDTAQLKSSIINLVKLLNYKPRRMISSKGKLQFSIAAPLTKKVFIPKYTECETSTGTKYLTTQDVVILVGAISVVASGIQGYIVETSRISDGALNAEIRLNDTEVENDNLFVYVAGVLWSEVDAFLDSVNTSKHYLVLPELDDTLTLRFGNNIFGMAPPSGQEILIRYIKSLGLAGNVYELDKVTKINSTIYDEDGDLVAVTVTNSDVFLGGDNAEDKEEVRTEAPKVFKTGDRGVNREDFVTLLENYPAIATANAWGENEENPPNYTMFNRVKLVVLLEEWQLPSITFKQDLSDYLYTKSMMTVKYEYITPQIIYVVPTLSVKVNRTGSLSAAQSSIEQVYNDQFVLGTTTKLGTSKRHSELVHIVEAIQDVAWHYMYLDVRKTLSIPFDSFYTYGSYLELVPVAPRSIKVFVGNQQVAIDDGLGGFTSLISAYTVSGLVNYTTGYLGLNISPTPPSGDEVYIRYQQNMSGDLVVLANQILRLYSVDITNIAFA